MRIFIIDAQPEPNSLNGALTRALQGALSAAGHEVVVSDLCAFCNIEARVRMKLPTDDLDNAGTITVAVMTCVKAAPGE
ncbi:hypothetical protein EN817_25230 [Mesorhizobium sp. M3A.F.Ca.ET.174.01.1.1]|uniref:NAD(P)H-dependent oxidoreductase n=1 Tax=unclassified Mesorhizobium TaxID=325217 RepID=UPI00109398B9|nr:MULTISPECIES: NAD(P)H-dependent oxidoreductase [unclassified Mesorhizobium]TGS64991.1 hypothetical protein EN844_20115 [Mesorhizobium sp. M3A.F.Ca.ET.201.01.1.1]TGS82747.1 hypothetical protein EN818_25280 [Mesorhizobium sp. M3A.F.Ca.ET.175.01.1.1]TGT22702.1 hypothetical protein EN817_25230 [Mesorhizobium sp. M3A.F.Ca.ET.174.01.1.1]